MKTFLETLMEEKTMKTFKKDDPEAIKGLTTINARKKPIIIQCVQIDEPFEVETLEGTMKGKKGDYLMIGVNGEMYPCDKEIFDKTYDIVE